MSDDLIALRLRSGLDNADKGADGVRELGGVVLTMHEAADRIEKLERELKAVLDREAGRRGVAQRSRGERSLEPADPAVNAPVGDYYEGLEEGIKIGRAEAQPDPAPAKQVNHSGAVAIREAAIREAALREAAALASEAEIDWYDEISGEWHRYWPEQIRNHIRNAILALIQKGATNNDE